MEVEEALEVAEAEVLQEGPMICASNATHRGIGRKNVQIKVKQIRSIRDGVWMTRKMRQEENLLQELPV